MITFLIWIGFRCSFYELAIRINVIVSDLGMPRSDELDKTKRLMGALVRMKPKPHEEMKVRKKIPVKRKKASSKSRSSDDD